MIKMDNDKLWNDSYTAEMALQDTILYYVDTYKFALRLLQASDIQKYAWKAFIEKNEISDNHLRSSWHPCAMLKIPLKKT